MLRISEISVRLPEPEATLADWQSQWSHYHTQLLEESSAANLSLDALDDRNFPKAISRLKHLAKAKKDQAQRISELLQPFFDLSKIEATALYQTLSARLPVSQNLLSYYANIHRDWAWNTEENSICARLLAPHLLNGKNVLIPGAGAGRLAFDLRSLLPKSDFYLLELNPLLLAIAHKLMHAQEVKLWEFPLAPRTLQEAAVLQSLKNNHPGNFSGNTNFILGDVRYLPFQKASIEQIILPWLTDIIPEPPGHFFARLNHVLQTGGRILYFGSHAFSFQNETWNHSPEELVELLASLGFQVSHSSREKIPYMQSPHSSHGRVEEVLLLVAEKQKNCEQPPLRELSLPEWINDPSKAIPQLPIFSALETTHQVPLDIVRAIDGRKSIEDIASAVLTKNYQMKKTEGVATLRNFFRSVLERARFR